VDVDRAPDDTDARLLADVAAAGGATRTAWSTLVTRHSPRLYAIARSFGFDAATAEDLVQTAWLRLLERVETMRDPGAVGAWLAMVVRNEARNRITRRREIPSAAAVEMLGERVGTEAPVDARMIGAERASALRLAFSQLGLDCQQLLRLTLADPPLSYDDIAAALGRPRGALGPSRRRCLDQLRSRLPSGFER
jgi:RNA polymerase sigma factor (sigma-70 family)